jgi:predicted nuclease of predicted toxin-antitoxin system
MQGHDVFSVYDEARGMRDDDILDKAYSQKWVLITNDKDFGEKIYRGNLPHSGVVFLRLQDERAAAKIAVLSNLLTFYSDRLPNYFVVVTESRVRFGRRREVGTNGLG